MNNIVSTLLLVAISVSCFSLVYLYANGQLDSFFDNSRPNVSIVAYGLSDEVRLEHYGGETIDKYQVYLNDEIIFEGEDFSFTDTITIPLSEQSDIIMVGDGDLVFLGNFKPYSDVVYHPETYDYYVRNNDIIQDVIDNALPGESIYVEPGIYYENIVIRSPVVLVGGPNTIIDGSGLGHVIDIANTNNVIIDGFYVRNSSDSWDKGGIRVKYCDNVTIKNNICSYNNNFGIWFDNVEYCDIINCNCSSNLNEGISIYNSHFCKIEYSDICYNGDTGLQQKFICTNNTIYQNNFILNCDGNGFDDSIESLWDFNFWSDYSGSGSYLIPDAGSQDHYPLIEERQ